MKSAVSLSNELAAAVERTSHTVVAIHGRQRTPSSGVHWRPGVIVTADHTLERDEEITLTLPDDRTVAATLAGRDPSTDLAVLKSEGASLPAAETGDPGALKIGHLVLAVGRGPSASLGVISALGGAWRTWRGGQIDQFVRLDLAIYTGFSGGALVDTEGRILGINTSGLSRRTGVAIPASTVNRVTDELLAKGRIARGYLGLGMQPVRLPDTFRTKLNLTGSGGLIVLSVEPEGPAAQAGVLVGDVLVGLGEHVLGDTDDVQAALGPEQVGRTIPAKVVRAGSLTELAITVSERPRKSA